MMFTGITNALRGISGEFEINRVVGAFGAAAYVICGNGFVAWSMAKGQPFDLTAYCLAFPSGLAVAVGAIAGAVAIKDRNVAVARTVRDTGSMPGNAANPAPSGTQSVEVVNDPSNPVPTTEGQP